MIWRTFFIFIIVISGCARTEKKESTSSSILLKRGSYSYHIQENSGEYFLKKENGWSRGNTFTTKRTLQNRDQTTTLEKSISFSKSGSLKNGVRLMLPEQSQYVVWFNKEKYTSIIKIDEKKKSFVVTVKSPEARWNGSKEIKFPSTTTPYCYFYQIIECAANMGFIGKSKSLKSMLLDLYIVWEGYPFIQEQYSGLPDNVFTMASLSFDGKNENGDYKFSLRFAEQMIAYVVDKKFRYYRMFWISQGLAMTLKSVN